MAKAKKNEINETAPATLDDSVITYGMDFSAPFNSFPAVNVARAFQRTVNHIMGNEVAASVLAGEKAHVAKKLGKSTADVTADELRSHGYNDSERAVALFDARVTKWAILTTGELGARTSGPRLTTIESYIRDVCDERLAAIARKKGHAMWKGEALKAARARVMELAGAAIKAEAETRMNAAQADADFEIEV